MAETISPNSLLMEAPTVGTCGGRDDIPQQPIDGDSNARLDPWQCPPISLLMEAPTIDALDRSSLAVSPNSLLMEAPKAVIAYGKDGASQLILMSKQPIDGGSVNVVRIHKEARLEITNLDQIAYRRHRTSRPNSQFEEAPIPRQPTMREMKEDR